MAVNINVPSQVKTYANLAAFPASGALKTIYIAEDTNKTYRWDGSTYVEISASAATGLTIGTTPIASGTIGRVLFQGTGNVLQQSGNLFWDNATNLFDIIGTNRLTGTASVVPIFALNAVGASSNSAYIDLRVNNSSMFQMGYTRAGGLNRFFIYNNALAAPNDIVRIYETTNNIGINTATDAGFRLDVNGTARFTGQTTYATTMNFGGNTDQISPSSNSGNFDFISNLPIRFVLRSGSVERMRIVSSTGNVLINTTTDAGFRLDVNGTARVSGTGNVFTINESSNSRNFTFNPSYATSSYGGFITHSLGHITLGANLGTDNGSALGIYLGGVSANRNASALLQMDSTTKGFLPPRMTTTQRNAIASPAAGLIVYDTTLNLPHFFNGTIWVSL